MRAPSALLVGLALGAASALALLETSSTASGTTLVHASVEELALASEAVARGVVADVTPTWGGPNGRPGIFSRVTLAVDDTIAGATRSELVFMVHGGRIGERAMRVHGQASFDVGEEVVVFLFRDGEALFPTGMSQGKWIVRRGRDAGATVSSSADPRALVERDGERGLVPFAGGSDVMPLDVLRARVRAARGMR